MVQRLTGVIVNNRHHITAVIAAGELLNVR